MKPNVDNNRLVYRDFEFRCEPNTGEPVNEKNATYAFNAVWFLDGDDRYPFVVARFPNRGKRGSFWVVDTLSWEKAFEDKESRPFTNDVGPFATLEGALDKYLLMCVEHRLMEGA